MNNTKRMVISAAFLLVAVGGLMTAAVRRGSVLASIKGLSYETKVYEVTDAFTDIRVEDLECNVRILRAADGPCRVVCPEMRDGSVYHTVTVNGGELSVQRHDQRKWYQRIGVSLGTPDVEVCLPEKEYGRLALHSTAGSIRVDDGFTFESARLESISGSVQMLSEVEKELQVQSTSGRVAIENASPEKLTAKSVSSRVELAHIRGGEIIAQSTSGRIELADVVAERSLYAKSISGGVALDGCDGGTIWIETTSGSVKGSILSDKTFMTHSTSGSVKVPRCAGGGECEITTASGSIVLEIRQ